MQLEVTPETLIESDRRPEVILPEETTTLSLELDFILNRLSEIVSEHGPLHLTRGMNMYEANRAILLCLEDRIATEQRLLVCLRKVEELGNEEQRRRRKLEARLTELKSDIQAIVSSPLERLRLLEIAEEAL